MPPPVGVQAQPHLPSPTRPNKELFNCSELRLPSSPLPPPSPTLQGPLTGSRGSRASGRAGTGGAEVGTASPPLPHCAFSCAGSGSPGPGATRGGFWAVGFPAGLFGKGQSGSVVAPGSIPPDRAAGPSSVAMDVHQHWLCLQRLCVFGF